MAYLIRALLVFTLGASQAVAAADFTCRLSPELIADFSNRTERVEALALSGGGSRGAWGAGYLSGWRESTQAPQTLDVVTGVSVGALLATHAYLGLYEDRGAGLIGLNTIFQGLGNRQVRRTRVPLLWALFSDSSHSNARLANTLRRVITQELLLELNKRQQTQPGLLCVATVNLRSGQLVRWDLTRIAQQFAQATGAGRDALLDLYRNVLLAATSIPGVFSPTEISFAGNEHTVENSRSNDLHIDAGVRRQVVGPAQQQRQQPGAFANEYGSLFSELQRSQAPSPEVFVLINAQTTLDDDWPGVSRVFPVASIAQRSVLIILNETARNSRQQIFAQANEFGAACSAVAMNPEDVRPQTCSTFAKANANGPSRPIEPLEFDCSPELFALGAARGQASDWQNCADYLEND